MSFDTLPIEVLQTIFRFLAGYDLREISLVCHRWAAAAEPILAARKCIAISHREFSNSYYARYDPNMYRPTKLVDILHSSNRKDTCIRVEWDKSISERDDKTLKEILKICQEQFSLQKLHVKTFPCKTLTGLFDKPSKWLKNLTELHIEQSKNLHPQPTSCSTIEISLPKLQRLTWLEEEPRNCAPVIINGVVQLPTVVSLDAFRFIPLPRHLEKITNGSFQSAILDVPELEYLKVKVEMKNETPPTSPDNSVSLEQPNGCCLFLPNLQLKSCSNLKHVHIEELFELEQRLLIKSKVFWQNLRSLTFRECGSYVIERICEECSKLQELSISKTYGAIELQNLSVLSRSLKTLTLKSVPIDHYRSEIEFSKLQHIHLINSSDSGSLNLIAPKLTKISLERIEYNLFTIFDKQETGPTVLKFDPLHETPLTHSLPNVTEINLRLRVAYGGRNGLVQDYINCCPNLRRLTLSAKWACIERLELNLKKASNLEYLCGDGLIVRLADFHELIHLQTLKLTECTITANPDDGAVMLTELRDIRMKTVKLEGFADRTWDRWDHFPIYGSGVYSSSFN